MKNFFRFLPNAITMMNLLAGSIAIVLALEGNPGYAGIMILVAGLFDFLDGFTARLLHAYSPLGKELDSLADVVSFGVAPGIIAFVLLKKTMPGFNLPLTYLTPSLGEWALLLLPFMIPVFSALRLAKFNLDTRQQVNFLGMPTPANAILWASFGIVTEFTTNPEIPVLLFTKGNLLVIMIATSLLLISELPMFSLKFTGINLKQNWYRVLFIGISLVLLLTFEIYGLSLVILFYILMSLVLYLLKTEL